MKPTLLPVNRSRLRAELRHLDRGDLLLMIERAIELVSEQALGVIVADYIGLDGLRAPASSTSLLDEVREFSRDALAGRYYRSFAVNSSNSTMNSPGTEHFISDMDRLMNLVLASGGTFPDAEVREMFELLFAPIHRSDEGMDDVVFFADEGGSWIVGVVWGRVLPAYFKVLAKAAPPGDFARACDRVIEDFVEHERLKFIACAERAATVAQREALNRGT